MRSVVPAALGLFVAACASTPSVPPPGPSGPAPASRPKAEAAPASRTATTRPEGALPPGHPTVAGRDAKPPPDEPGVELDDPGEMAEAWRRPYLLLDGHSGARLDKRSLEERFRAARVIYVAEKHDEASHHQVQLEVLARTAKLGPVQVGLEMVQRPFQPGLDAFTASGDEDALLEAVEWAERWGFDFRLYRPIFRIDHMHGLPLVALNARKELSRAIATGGLSSLSETDRRALPELVLDHGAHRVRIHLIWTKHVAPHGGMSFENFYTAQVLWDETMADTVAKAMRMSDARMVVLAGAGHIRYGEGIPMRAARRGARPALSILPLELSDAAELVASGVADILWVLDGPGSP